MMEGACPDLTLSMSSLARNCWLFHNGYGNIELSIFIETSNYVRELELEVADEMLICSMLKKADSAYDSKRSMQYSLLRSIGR